MNWFAFDRDLMASPRGRMAMFSLAVAVFLFIAASIRAIQLEPPETGVMTNTPGSRTPVLEASAVQIDPEAVVEQDIFSIDRTAPAERYPMPGEVDDTPPPAPAGPPPPRPLVLGTAVGLDGAAFATAHLPNMPPRIIRVGDKLGIYTVVAITRGTVTFRAADGVSFEVNAP